MVELVNKEFNALPNRNSLKHDDDILKEYRFTEQSDANCNN